MYRVMFIFSMILYGLARATQQGSIFSERNREPRHLGLSKSSEIHLYGYGEPVGLVLGTIS